MVKKGDEMIKDKTIEYKNDILKERRLTPLDLGVVDAGRKCCDAKQKKRCTADCSH